MKKTYQIKLSHKDNVCTLVVYDTYDAVRETAVELLEETEEADTVRIFQNGRCIKKFAK